MPVLTIKNETAADLDIRTGVGAPIKLAAGAAADVDEPALKTRAVAEALQDGRISFVPKADLSPEQVKVARELLAPMVTTTGAQMINYKGRYEQARQEMVRLRDAYNTAWKTADTSLAAAEAAAQSWEPLQKAVKGMVIEKSPEHADIVDKKNTLKRLTDELAELKKKDVQAANLDAWYAARLAKEKELTEAQDALDKALQAKGDPLVTEVRTVAATSSDVIALAKNRNKAIGKEIPELTR